MGAKTRRQKAALGVQSEDSDVPSPNGNGAVKSPSKKSKSKSPSRRVSPGREKKENVFLFAPNLIGRRIAQCSMVRESDLY